MTARILCIGNRFVGEDDFGPRVYDVLAEMARPATGRYGCEAGLPFLLRVLPAVVDHPPPRIRPVSASSAARGRHRTAW